MRSLAQIKTEMIDDILDLRSDVRIVEGDTQYDIVISSPANQFYRYEILLELENRTRNLTEFTSLINDEGFKTTVAQVLGYKQDGTAYTVDDVNDIISDRLDAYVEDWGLVRSTGSKATGIDRVFLSDASAVSWDNGTTFTNSAGVSYIATSSVSNVTPNFDTAVGLYYVDIPIEASVAGLGGNATAGSVRTMDPKPTNFSYCLNQSSVDGGSDAETDLDLIDRAQEVWAERVNGSKGAFERIGEAEDYVDDVYATDVDDNVEEVYLGSVCDIWTQFTALDSELVEEFFYWPGEAANNSAEVFEFTPKNQPLVTTISPIIYKYTIAGVEEQVDTTDTDVSVSTIADTDTFIGSTKANDKISIQMILNTDNYQRKLKVLYTYDKSPYKLQNVFNSSEEQMTGPHVLVKKAAEVPLRVIVELQISFGETEADVQTNVINNIQAYFNGGTTTFVRQYARKKIGEDIYHSDISDIILRTSGVTTYDTDTFFVVNTLNGDLSDPTIIKNNQYAALHDVLFEYSTYNLANFTANI